MEFSNVMGVICAAFPDINISRETVDIYFSELKDLEYDVTCVAVKELIATSIYFPRISQIREKYISLIKPENTVTTVDAIKILNNAISNFGRYRTIEALEYIKRESTALYEIINAIGFRNICSADMNRYRVEVEALYKESEKEIRENAVLSTALKNRISMLSDKISSSALYINSVEN